MSQEIINQLTTDKATLEKDLAQHKQALESLSAQLDANKQMFNESLNSGLQLRTHFIMLQRQFQELSNKNAELTKENADLKAKLSPA